MYDSLNDGYPYGSPNDGYQYHSAQRHPPAQFGNGVSVGPAQFGQSDWMPPHGRSQARSVSPVRVSTPRRSNVDVEVEHWTGGRAPLTPPLTSGRSPRRMISPSPTFSNVEVETVDLWRQNVQNGLEPVHRREGHTQNAQQYLLPKSREPAVPSTAPVLAPNYPSIYSPMQAMRPDGVVNEKEVFIEAKRMGNMLDAEVARMSEEKRIREAEQQVEAARIRLAEADKRERALIQQVEELQAANRQIEQKNIEKEQMIDEHGQHFLEGIGVLEAERDALQQRVYDLEAQVGQHIADARHGLEAEEQVRQLQGEREEHFRKAEEDQRKINELLQEREMMADVMSGEGTELRARIERLHKDKEQIAIEMADKLAKAEAEGTGPRTLQLESLLRACQAEKENLKDEVVLQEGKVLLLQNQLSISDRKQRLNESELTMLRSQVASLQQQLQRRDRLPSTTTIGNGSPKSNSP